ncbi:MAG: transcriptional repressor [Solirubrobacterales bacterium]
MTEPVQTPPLRFEGKEDVFAALRAEGFRVSTPCRHVVNALFASADPVSAQQIAARAEIPGADLSSVYRNLERLENLGVVRHVHLGHGPSLYMLVGSGEREYLLCERCGRARSLDPTELDPIRDQIERRFGHRARFGHFPIVGLCAECAAAE